MAKINLRPGEVVSGERRLGQQELFARGARAASALASLGVGAGDVIGVLMRNDFPLLEATIAATTLGAYAAPVNWHFTGEEAAQVMVENGAKVVVGHADLLPRLQAQLPGDLPVLHVPTPPEIQEAYGIAPGEGAAPEGARGWPEWIGEFSPHPRGARPEQLNQLHTIMFSGGTTGRSKAIRRLPITPEQERRLFETLTVTGAARVHINGPMYHNSPSMTCLSAVRVGAAVVLQPRFEPEWFLADVERFAITNTHLVPTMFVRLLKLPPETRARYDLSSLELVLHGAAPCALDVKRAMIEWFGPVLREYYGGTETGGICQISSEEWLAHPGSVGKVVENARVEIVDDAGNPVPRGEVGEIYMWNATQPQFTYHGQPALRDEITRDGLVTCGDMGYLDQEGYLYLCDRKKDMVISAGVNIYPAEIEGVLIGLPGVRDCAVFGIPDQEFGESLAAVVQPEPGVRLTAEGVRAFLAGRMAGFKVPKLVEFRDELPREDSGKIFKRKLRDPYWAGTGRNI